MTLQLLKDQRIVDPVVFDLTVDEEDATRGIRCPLCSWQPSPGSRWHCQGGVLTPEPEFAGCGTVWNTFSTAGRCPGCSHQWKWTSCLSCSEWSLHDDWYEGEDGRRRH